MRVAIVVGRPDWTPDFLQQPVEAIYAATILEQRGHLVKIIDLRLEKSAEEFNSHLAADLAFIITQTYDLTQCYSISLIESEAAVASLRRSWPKTPIVAVGVHASVETDMTARDLGVDCALPGEIEVAVPWLVDAYEVEGRKAFERSKDAPRMADTTALPVPNYGLVDLSAYWGEVVNSDHRSVRRGTTGLIFANRGCPYSCSYCFVWFGSRVRQRPVRMVVEELKEQKKRGVNSFFFLDYTFTLNRTWVKELCDEIISQHVEVSWVCQTRCERVDVEILSLMRQAGCEGVFYGIEAPWISEAGLDKPISAKVIEEAIDSSVRSGIHPMLFVLLGIEDGQTSKVFELRDWLAAQPVSFLVSRLTPRPFTDLWRKATDKYPKPESWRQYAILATYLRDEIYSSNALRDCYESVTQLPNYAGRR